MFHVSTLLPYFEADEQKVYSFDILSQCYLFAKNIKQIERKRHLGNDIVVIIYKEGSTLFPPSICKSVFNRKCCLKFYLLEHISKKCKRYIYCGIQRER